MFTGLIQHIGRIVEDPLPQEGGGQRLRVDVSGWTHAPSPGESIAVNGCCLTVAELGDGLRGFDVIAQTLELTSLGGLRAGHAVNLEHAATPTTLLGGHIVQGHVDTVGTVLSMNTSANECRCRVAYESGFDSLLVPQGSIAVDGVSLTVAGLGAGWFEVALIPTTLTETTFGSYTTGDRVNLEFDVIAKMVAAQVSRGSIEHEIDSSGH
ncbi:MAG: riboflavin synthase [Phycisphaerales bacterium]|jgi:riboflavin synthase|nr:riboflavin synthase [Phycisphaerales bacterium]MDP6986772.1 riboflavin synthase [Phycisphaerales bacterium]